MLRRQFCCSSSWWAAALCLATGTLLLLLATPLCAASCPRADRDALLSFLSNISTPAGSPLAPSWAPNATADCCLWEGVSCGADGSVTRLWLPERGLAGTISPSLGVGLPRLAHLNLSHNRLSGSLPQGLLWSDHIAVLDVSYNLLSGELPQPAWPSGSSPGRLPTTAIESLNVSSNQFTGEFPRLGGPELRAVNASNNGFSGAIPHSPCSAWPRLRSLDLSRNRFGGGVPGGLGNCSELVELRAGVNNLSGPIPADLYDAGRLLQLSLPYNQLAGVLPGERLSRLARLVLLDLGGNQLRGALPEAIGELTDLEELHLNDNHLNGTLPSALRNCTKLRYLNLRANDLAGDISAVDLSPLSRLAILDMGNNNFTGEFPASLYSCTSLRALRLAQNRLRGRISPQIQGLQALSYLSLSRNKLEGVSDAFRILAGCRNLTVALLAWSFEQEAMPDDGGGGGGGGPRAGDWPVNAFSNLRVLSLWGCRLTGRIPSWIARLQKLQVLDLSGNRLTGTIPGWLGSSLPNLFYLEVSDNLLSGELPSEITGMKALRSSDEEAVLQVEQGFIELPLFRSFRLLYNRLSSFPPTLNLSGNGLSGAIPPGIGLLQRLHVLDLARNNFSGEIPVQLCDLSRLETLNLSWNRLSGPIPPTLTRLSFLSSFSVAHNDLSGPIPWGAQFSTFPNSSFEGNPGLCGSVLQRPCTGSSPDGHGQHKRPGKKILVGIILTIVFGGAFVFSMALLLVLACKMSGRRGNKNATGGLFGATDDDVEATSSNSADIPGLHHSVAAADTKVVMLPSSPWGANRETEEEEDDHHHHHLTLSDVLKATNNFHKDNIVGCGAFGLVYKADLPDGGKLAIKRLVGDMGLMEREFAAEVEALSSAQHKNLVSLRGYYVHGSFRLLVYSYMENGSLDYWLHEAAAAAAEDEGHHSPGKLAPTPPLDWPARLRIAQGASEGLAYIHRTCQPHIVHRDIKSSNILLDRHLEAHLADFGLSRLILPHKTHVTTELVGTLGYIPPEYGQAWVATLRGDIYSFGVVLLELLTGRRPIDPCRPKQSAELVVWVRQMRRQGEQEQVFDPQLRGRGGFEEQMSQVLGIACLCVDHDPAKRPTIQEVVSALATVGS